jgi:hypothetical protein
VTTTGAVYPEVAELLEQLPKHEARMALQAEAVELLQHPDAHFERVPRSRENRFVTYREGPIGTQTLSVPIPTRMLLDAHSARPSEALDRLRTVAFLGLIELLENEVR